MEYTLQFTEWFYDMAVYPKRLKPGQIIRVDETTKNRIEQSTPGCFEVLGMEVPKSSVKPQPKTSKKDKESDGKD